MLLNGQNPVDIHRAAEALAAGELLGLPTETVYGLGARADSDAAVAKIFAAKGRPADHPLIVHVLDAKDAAHFAAVLPPVAQRLMAAFWPGPLTVIVPRAEGVGAAAAGGQNSIGLRCPAHPVARAVLAAARELGVRGVAAPSANRFGRVSPTRAGHVLAEFDPGLLVLDGGDCEVGIESSIVDCSRAHPALLRPGVLTLAQIEAAAGEPLHAPDAQAPRASGTLLAHYAPRAAVRLKTALQLQTAVTGGLPAGLAVYSRTVEAANSPLARQMPADARAVAHELFAVLRDLDAAGAHEIWIETPPYGPEWDGVRDRLSRASAAFEP
ncbi:L-threonylcarbamoyladenylate synthase [Paucibacter sp. APW11]|uniref:Threonylcarbamoyl-AMP synthase n=1 Tax=Roseateles aquae TaxID=3077235 RepID=A0ABU3PCQ0_9BURK|nr:L-threonylcarbamoyladenylate synthase [Paucibacter sp. APW11]MDT8999641.1 L-threonylcarbamoyladenylate synthase [Paucibacter sp. APW11]